MKRVAISRCMVWAREADRACLDTSSRKITQGRYDRSRYSLITKTVKQTSTRKACIAQSNQSYSIQSAIFLIPSSLTGRVYILQQLFCVELTLEFLPSCLVINGL